ncbi:2,3-bisphosphoglycerate-dependent phosphoglycerate mutase [bioreactor metagenome]|uniref:2,3-bisphosphoglycerate-dependent phosphoglycerate mutase n=1 Tax=bioreactor metagenome TaxID=1076179 RepID=A0A644YG94_9ZZZZ
MEIILLRHGKTAANLDNRYNGRTDDPLCEEGLQEANSAQKHASFTHVYVSPLLRARQTAGICFPNAEQIVVNDLREMNFGDFEGRTADEMEHDSAYRAWVESNGMEACPNGESVPQFARRAAGAFVWVVGDAAKRGLQQIGVTAHGGVIMAIMYSFSHSDQTYYDWYVQNCGGFRLVIDESGWAEGKPGFVSYERFGEAGDSQAMLGGESKA